MDHVLPLIIHGTSRRRAIHGLTALFGRAASRHGRLSTTSGCRHDSGDSGGCTTTDVTRPPPLSSGRSLLAEARTSNLKSWHARSISRFSTTAYTGVAGDGTLGLDKLSFRLPLVVTLPQSQRVVEIDSFKESDWEMGMDLMNLVIREGKSWPFENEFVTMDAYRAYFLSHAAFCVRDHDPQSTRSTAATMLGCFYVKPNFPGRCSHVCNGGFVTAPEARRQGVATLMGRVYLPAAKDLGYRSSYFNLVFANNAASVNLWESLGFERVAVLPKAARTNGSEDGEGGGLETAYGYWYDLDALPSNYLSEFVTNREG